VVSSVPFGFVTLRYVSLCFGEDAKGVFLVSPLQGVFEMRYQFTLTGVSDLIMHQDSVEWADTVQEWRLSPNNPLKKGENKGDDRRPAWTWLGYMYHDNKHVAIPSSYIVGVLKKAGARISAGGNKTFKEKSVSGIFVEDEFIKFFVDGKQIPVKELLELIHEPVFSEHVKTVREHGFELFTKRVPIKASKNVRVRPRFTNWSASGILEVTTDAITTEILSQLFTLAGRIGIGDWRPGSPISPGPYGMFDTILKLLK